MAQLTFDDICAGRHGGAETSVEANKKPDKEIDRDCVRKLIRSHANGVTLHEACAMMKRQPNEISGRFTELRVMNLIYCSGRREYRGHTGRVYYSFTGF